MSVWNGSQKYYLSFRTGLAMKFQMTVIWKYGPLVGTEKSITVFLALPYTLGWSLLSQPPFKTTFLRCPQTDEKNIEERNFLHLRFMAFVDSSWLSPFRDNIQKKELLILWNTIRISLALLFVVKEPKWDFFCHLCPPCRWCLQYNALIRYISERKTK